MLPTRPVRLQQAVRSRRWPSRRYGLRRAAPLPLQPRYRPGLAGPRGSRAV